MSVEATFWLDCLQRGATLPMSHSWEDVSCNGLYEQYIEFAKECGARYRQSSRMFGKTLRKICPSIELDRKPTGDRAYDYRLPSLDEARDAMSHYINATIDWEQ